MHRPVRDRRFLRRLLVNLALLLVAIQANAGTEGPTVNARQVEMNAVSLTAYFAVLEDPTQALTLAEVRAPDVAVRFKSAGPVGESLNFGFNTAAYWLRLNLKNEGDQPLDTMLEVAYPHLASVQLYQPGSGADYSVASSGSLVRFAERPYAHHFFVFPLTLPSKSDYAIYLRVQTPDALEFPAKLWSAEHFHRHERSDYLHQAGYFGMVTALILFNLLLFAILRDLNYLLYVLFAACVALTIAGNTGLGAEFLWGNQTGWIPVSTVILVSASNLVLLIFMRRMLATRLSIPRLDVVLKLFVGLHLMLPMAVLASFEHAIKPALISHSVTALLILTTGVVCAFRRQRIAYFFVAAFAALGLAIVISNLRALDLVPSNALTTHGTQFGSAIALLVFAFALVDGFYVIRREKENAQAQALRAQALLVETLQSSERALEARVAERTRELTTTIDRLRLTQDDLIHSGKLASLGALVAGVAHELNTPLGNASITAAGLESAALKFKEAVGKGDVRQSSVKDFVDRAQQMSEFIQRSCERAAQLILSFKQVAVDQTFEQRRQFDLRTLVFQNIATLRPSFDNKPWTIDADIPPDIVCDSYPEPLGQAISALIQNAQTHAFEERTSGTIRIAASLQGDSVDIHFADNGKGMTPEILERIFEPFFSTQMGQGGSGLGLSITKNIVTGVLGGTLSASSEPGKGSLFSVRFPRVAP